MAAHRLITVGFTVVLVIVFGKEDYPLHVMFWDFQNF